MRAGVRGSLILLVVGLIPPLCVIVAGGIATWNDCTLHEGFVNPCMVFGVDIGGALYTMGVMGWLMLFSLPMALAGLLGLIGAALKAWLFKR